MKYIYHFCPRVILQPGVLGTFEAWIWESERNTSDKLREIQLKEFLSPRHFAAAWCAWDVWSLGLRKWQKYIWQTKRNTVARTGELQLPFLSPRHFAAAWCAWDVWSLGGSRFSPSVSLYSTEFTSTARVGVPPKTGRKHLGWPDNLTWLANIANGLWG